MCDGRNTRIAGDHRNDTRGGRVRTPKKARKDGQENGQNGTGDKPSTVPIGPDGLQIAETVDDALDFIEAEIEKHPKIVKLLRRLLSD
jgi:hypothetical protein